jgi:hypothetical protein
MTKEIYKSSRGKTVDMGALRLKNEKERAVGNMKVNARGDKLGGGGEIIAGRNQVMDRVYAVGTAAPSGGYSPNDAKVFNEQQALVEANRAKELHDLAANLVKSTSIEPEESETSATPPARGSLASSVAKTAVVTQEPIPDPRKPTGPTRI